MGSRMERKRDRKAAERARRLAIAGKRNVKATPKKVNQEKAK